MKDAGSDRRGAATDGESTERGRGVVIAHPSPSIRVRLALALLEERPVFLASGSGGLLHHVELAQTGCVEAPCAIVLSAAQLRALRGPDRQACACTQLVVIDEEEVDGADAALPSLQIDRVLELLDAA